MPRQVQDRQGKYYDAEPHPPEKLQKRERNQKRASVSVLPYKYVYEQPAITLCGNPDRRSIERFRYCARELATELFSGILSGCGCPVLMDRTPWTSTKNQAKGIVNLIVAYPGRYDDFRRNRFPGQSTIYQHLECQAIGRAHRQLFDL